MKISIIKDKHNILYKLLKGVLITVFWILIWYIAYLIVDQDLLIVSPIDVVNRLFSLCGTSEFYRITGSSMLRIVIGFLEGVIVGTLLAILTSFLPIADSLFRPLINIIKATPVASFIILALVWMRTGDVPSFISFLMVLPIIWGNVTQGIIKTDKNLLQMANVYNLDKMKKIKKIYIPSVTPYFFAACNTSLGLAWKAGIAAEVIACTSFSIGQQIYTSKQYLDTVDLFAWTLVVILLSIILEKLMVYGMNKLSKKFSFTIDRGND